MKRWYLYLAGMLGLFLGMAFPLPSALGQSGCSVTNAAYPIPEGICGNNDWTLQVTYDGGVTANFGDSMAFGACAGGYFNGSNTYVGQYPIQGEAQWVPPVPAGDYGEFVGWLLDDWFVSYSSCINGNPNDEEISEEDLQSPTPNTK